jgi:hypothetical protein
LGTSVKVQSVDITIPPATWAWLVWRTSLLFGASLWDCRFNLWIFDGDAPYRYVAEELDY